MGASGSTAASCSSLDLTNNINSKRNNRYQHLHQRQQLGLNRSGLQTNHLSRQSTSYFDLSSSHIRDECDCVDGCEQSRNVAPTFQASDKQRHFAPPRICVDHEHNDSAIANIENYSISNANIGASRPIMVLPCKPISPALHLKKTNAGVASRILYQRKQQEQRYNDLRKFSDSLPSLNNPQSHLSPLQNQHNQFHRTKLTEPPTVSNSCYKQSRIIGQAYSPINHNDLHQCHKQTIINTSCQTGAKLRQLQANDYSQQHRVSNNLVNKSNEAFVRSKQRTSRQHYNYASKYNNVEHQQHCLSSINGPIDQRQSSLKRAISLSSLHNSNQAHQHPSHHNLNNHMEHICFEHSNSGFVGSARIPEAVGDRRASTKLIAQAGPYSASSRPNSLNSNCSSFIIADNRIKSKQQIACNHVDPNQMPLSQYNYHQPTHLAHSQASPGPVGKKVHKYKQAAPTVGNCEKRNVSKSNRYKAKQQQQQTAQQQGCQVLPPLPRSQSLHELIQLRATENGQRMRTTGTLRGPLGSSEPTNKVNLVAELLESRRQQRDNVGCRESAGEENQPTATMLSSQSLSSTDDGIHDVSIVVESNNSASVSPQSSQNNSNRKSTVQCRVGHVIDKNSAQAAGDNKISSTSDCKSRHQLSPSSKTDQISRCGGQPRGDIETRDKTRNQKFAQNTVVCGLALEPEKAHQQQLKLKVASHIKKSSQKSTLKRSLSQSALQQSGSVNGKQSFYTAASDDVEHDGDESDDLNELAKFLYQFKKLQANNAKNKSSTQQDAQHTSIKLNNEPSPSSSSSNERANQSLQQSPSSTTSSSGFASSTCTSQSSAGGDANKHKALSCYRRGTASPSNRPLSNFNCAKHADLKSKPALIGSRKKYPAPPRPNATNAGPSPIAGTSGDAKTSTARPIMGKLKLSSSLLSIVDEYQSTMQSEARQCSPQLKNANSTANLASVLMGANASTKQATNVSKGSDELRTDLVCNDGYAGDGSVSSNMQSEQQLNHLKRYTKLRQMSQSELALNHLINPISDSKSGLHSSHYSPVSDRKLIKGKVINEKQQKQASSRQINRNGSNASGSSKPYRSRLFNLIRRISDKTEIANPSESASGRLFVGLGEVGSVGGRCQQLQQDECTAWKSCQSTGQGAPTGGKLGAINQIGSEKLSQSTSSYSNKPEQLDYSFVKQQQRYRRNAEERGELRSADDGSGVDAAAASASSTSGFGRQILKGRASESLCDPSFDCDFESIKNCKPTRERLDGVGSKVDLHGEKMKIVRSLLSQRQPAVIAKAIGKGVSSKKNELNLQVTVNEENCKKSTVLLAKSKSKQMALMEGSNGRQQQQRAIDLVSLASENNWKLGLSTSLSTNPLPLNATTSAPASALKPNSSLAVDCGCGIDEQRLRTYSKSNNNNDRNYDHNKRHKSSVGLAETRRQTNNDDGCSASGTKLISGGKLRWSASGWFSNSAGGPKDKKRQQEREQKLKQKADVQQTKGQQKRAQGGGGGGRSYFEKLIPGKSQCARASSDFVSGLEERNTATGTSPSACEEADQLLDELDQSLDLVSGASLARLTPKLWWQRESVSAARNLDTTMINCYFSDDKDSEGDYASINQAMINETFDVQLADDGSQASANERDLCMNSSSKQHRAMIFEQAGSPSDSFTFSAPCSPEGNIKSSATNGVGEIHLQSNPNSPAISGLQRGVRRLHGC